MAGKHADTLADRVPPESDAAIRAVWVSTAGLAITAAIQFAIVLVGGSRALLADSLHNFGDVFTTVGLGIAFVASKRAATRRYTYGYERFEDLVGVLIVVIIAASAVLAGWESYKAFIEPRRVTALGVSIAAALVGVAGNELVAQYKIRVAKRIHSASLQADGHHSRADGLVSAGAAAGLVGVALGYPRADPIAGFAITAAIIAVAAHAGRDVIRRLVDAVDPQVIDAIEHSASAVDHVEDLHDVRARWAGRSLFVQLHIAVDENLPLHEAHAIAERVRLKVIRDVAGVADVVVHLDPWAAGKPQSAYHEQPLRQSR